MKVIFLEDVKGKEKIPEIKKVLQVKMSVV